MNESEFWQFLKDKMKQYWTADRIEDMLKAGIPDVSYAVPNHQGWIELKYMKEFPKKNTTKVRIYHWTPIQKAWMRKRGRVNPNVWLLVMVDEEIFLFSYKQLIFIEEWTAAEWRAKAAGYWYKGAFDAMQAFQTLNTGV